jgi:preprotein translocase subunit YajC
MGTIELAAAAKSGGFNPSTLILILIVVVAFYLLMIRPQQRRKQQAAQKQNDLAVGARVRTTAGMYATVVDVDGDDVVLEVAPGVEVRYMRKAVMDVVSPADVPEDVAEDVDLSDEAYEADEPLAEDEAFEHETAEDDVTVAHAEAADGTVADTTVEAPGNPATAEVVEADETPYEQATGSKKD